MSHSTAQQLDPGQPQLARHEPSPAPYGELQLLPQQQHLHPQQQMNTLGLGRAPVGVTPLTGLSPSPAPLPVVLPPGIVHGSVTYPPPRLSPYRTYPEYNEPPQMRPHTGHYSEPAQSWYTPAQRPQSLPVTAEQPTPPPLGVISHIADNCTEGFIAPLFSPISIDEWRSRQESADLGIAHTAMCPGTLGPERPYMAGPRSFAQQDAKPDRLDELLADVYTYSVGAWAVGVEDLVRGEEQQQTTA